MVRTPRVVAAVVLMALALPYGAKGQTTEEIKRGSAIAAERCGKCHGVGVADASPHKIVLPLRDLHERFPVPMLDEALSTGQVGGHDEMPAFDLGIDGARALVAYIDSLNSKGPQYLGSQR